MGSSDSNVSSMRVCDVLHRGPVILLRYPDGLTTINLRYRWWNPREWTWRTYLKDRP